MEISQIPAADVTAYLGAQEALEIALDENESDGSFSGLAEFVSEQIWLGFRSAPGPDFDRPYEDAEEIAHNTVSAYFARHDLRVESPFDGEPLLPS
jgi:hypothetical protein